MAFGMRPADVRRLAPPEGMARRMTGRVLATCVLALGVSASAAFAWNCPVQIKAAEDAINRAEAMKLTGEAKGLLEEAKRTLAEAKRNHANASAKIDHANAIWRAKAAQAQAEAAAALSTP